MEKIYDTFLYLSELYLRNRVAPVGIEEHLGNTKGIGQKVDAAAFAVDEENLSPDLCDLNLDASGIISIISPYPVPDIHHGRITDVCTAIFPHATRFRVLVVNSTTFLFSWTHILNCLLSASCLLS